MLPSNRWSRLFHSPTSGQLSLEGDNVLFLLLICFPDTGECQAVTSYATQQECRAAATDAKRALRVATNFFVTCTAGPGVGR